MSLYHSVQRWLFGEAPAIHTWASAARCAGPACACLVAGPSQGWRKYLGTSLATSTLSFGCSRFLDSFITSRAFNSILVQHDGRLSQIQNGWSWEQGGQGERNRRTESGGGARTPEAEDLCSPWRPSALGTARAVGGSQKIDRQTFFNLIIYIFLGGWCGSDVDRTGCKARKTARERKREGESRQAGDPQLEARAGQVGGSESSSPSWIRPPRSWARPKKGQPNR